MPVEVWPHKFNAPKPMYDNREIKDKIIIESIPNNKNRMKAFTAYNR